MAITQLEQAVRMIENASRVLITLPKRPSIDSSVAGSALQSTLSRLGKQTTLLCEEFLWSKKLSFLQTPITASSLDLLPKTASSFDLIIFVGIRDAQKIGTILGEYYHLFSNTPIVNIDCSWENEGMGHLHLVDLTAPSISELLLPLLEKIGPHLITEEVATLLLCGIIDQTRAFRIPHIPSKTLRTSSLLIKYGADREKIITHFYRTRTVPVLKLWGKTLSRLEHDQHYHIAWSRVYYEDFVATQSTTEDLWGIIDEVITNIPNISAVLLFYEREDKTYHGVMSLSHPLLLPQQVLPKISIQGSRRFSAFSVKAQSLLEGETRIIQTLKSNLEKIQNSE